MIILLRKQKRIVYVFLLIVSLFGVASFAYGELSTSAVVDHEQQPAVSDVATSSRHADVTDLQQDAFPITITGLATPQRQVEVRARTSGVVQQLYVAAGARVAAGSALYQQSLPVAVQQAVATDAAGAVQRLQSNREATSAEFQTEQSVIESRTSQEIAALQSVRDVTAVKQRSALLETSLEETLQSLLEAFLFVNSERQLFTVDEQAQYQRVVQDLYGQLPNYLVGRVRHTITEPAALIEMLQNEEWSAVELAGMATAVDVQVTELLRVLQKAEREVVDADPEFTSQALLKRYLAQRSTLLERQTALRNQVQALWQQVDGQAIVSAQDAGTIAVTELQAQQSAQLASWQNQIVRATEVRTAAEQAVADAKVSLGSGTSPWSAVVERVYVDPGAYVAAGEPILRLQSQEGLEVEAVVPLMGTDRITPGLLVELDQSVVGVIDRVVSEPTYGRRVVYVTITDPTIQVGAVVRGTVLMPLADDYHVLNRAQIQFTNAGVFANIEDEQRLVEIIRDRGDSLLVRTHLRLDR